MVDELRESSDTAQMSADASQEEQGGVGAAAGLSQPSDLPSTSTGSSMVSMQPMAPAPLFKAPPNPSIPQDVSLIMEMVSANQVVGSLPPLAMSAAAKRKLVEESIASAKAKGKAKEVVPPVAASIDDSDSSSEEESSSEEQSGEGAVLPNRPGGAGRSHEDMKAELDSLIGASVTKGEVEMDSDSEEESSEEEDNEPDEVSSPVAGRPAPRQPIKEDLDEEGPVPSDPILSIHEDRAPPVAQPLISRLPSGEDVRLAGEVVSWMKDKKVEVWVSKEQAREEAEEAMEAERVMIEDEPSEATDAHTGNDQPGEPGEIIDSNTTNGPGHAGLPIANGTVFTVNSSPAITEAESSKAPHFASAGTIVIRAMQSQPGSAEDGWLEEGSVVCWQDGRVVGTISETFGPLTSPFYSIRLPPPPYPYPASGSLDTGTRLFYASNPSYRSFVNMHAVRDPRFKGSDASNIYDEEIGEDEMEWSDDEAEAEAKRRRKASRGSRAPSINPGQRRQSNASQASTVGLGGGHSSLPQRPHFDFQPQFDDSTETASMYGDEGSVYGSEDGSVVSQGSRRALPGPYDDLVGTDAGPQGQGRSRGRVRGRGGRGGDRDSRGRGGRARGGGGGGGRGVQDHRPGRVPSNGSGPPRPIHQEHWHPPAPPSPGLQQSSGYGAQQPFYPPAQSQFNQPMPFGQPPMPYQMSFNPSAPFPNGGVGQPGLAQPQWPGAPQHFPGGSSPAINPRFGGQYGPSQSYGGPWQDSE